MSKRVRQEEEEIKTLKRKPWLAQGVAKAELLLLAHRFLTSGVLTAKQLLKIEKARRERTREKYREEGRPRSGVKFPLPQEPCRSPYTPYSLPPLILSLLTYPLTDYFHTPLTITAVTLQD